MSEFEYLPELFKTDDMLKKLGGNTAKMGFSAR